MQYLHVAFLTTEYIIPPDKIDGGLATYLQKVGRELVQRGHNVTVFCMSDRNYVWNDMGVKVIEVSDNYKKPIIRLSRFLPYMEGIEKIFLNSDQLAKMIWKIHNETPIDLLQAPSLHSPAITLCGNGKIPLIVRISSYSPLLRTIEGQQNSLSASLQDWCERFQVEHADLVFGPSERIAKYYSLFTLANPIVLRTPIDRITKDFDTSFYQKHLKSKKYLLYFGTLNRVKGIDIFSNTISEIIEGNPDIHFVIIGQTMEAPDGQTYAEKVIEKNKANIRNIHYFSSLPKKQLFPIIKHAVAVVIPSRIDNYPNTCIEAMQFGRIVIGFEESSLEELITHGKTGFLTKNGDAYGLIRLIQKVLSFDEDKLKFFEKSILNFVEEILKKDRVGELEGIYQKTVASYKQQAKTKIINWKQIILVDKWKKYLFRGFIPISLKNIIKKLIQ